MYEFIKWRRFTLAKKPITISGKKFEKFLDWCFDHSTYFTMCDAEWFRCTDNALQTDLKPFQVKEISTLKWYGYDYTQTPPGYERKIKVHIYKSDSKAKEVILKHCADIFLRTFENGELKDGIQNLEDLCFFDEDRLLVGTITHESMLHVFSSDKDFKKMRYGLGRWEYCNREPMEFPEINH